MSCIAGRIGPYVVLRTRRDHDKEMGLRKVLAGIVGAVGKRAAMQDDCLIALRRIVARSGFGLRRRQAFRIVDRDIDPILGERGLGILHADIAGFAPRSVIDLAARDIGDLDVFGFCALAGCPQH